MEQTKGEAMFSLSPEKIILTAESLESRIRERFPRSNLLNICKYLASISAKASERSLWLAQPIWPLRLFVLVIIGFIAALVVILFQAGALPSEKVQLVDLVQAIEAGINDFFFLAAALFFLVTWEARIKRNRALRAIHELRSIAHVIDMYQLTKDPDRVVGRLNDTSSSPRAKLNPFELTRYLDYCSEMLSLIGKIAALYAEHLNDSVVLGAVNEIESLTNGFSRKIWQKIMILQAK